MNRAEVLHLCRKVDQEELEMMPKCCTCAEKWRPPGSPRRPPGGRPPGGPQEAPRRPPGGPGGTQEAPRRPPGGSQELPRRPPGGPQEAPRRLSGGFALHRGHIISNGNR